MQNRTEQNRTEQNRTEQFNLMKKLNEWGWSGLPEATLDNESRKIMDLLVEDSMAEVEKLQHMKVFHITEKGKYMLSLTK